jgi:hypothetical protein
MVKTGKQVQSDVISLLKGSALASLINGQIYRNGMRPRDSQSEDAIVTFTAGLSDQIQTGVVTINIFVPDIDPYSNGVRVEDGQRLEEIEIAAAEWVSSLTTAASDYKFSLQSAIQTQEEPDLNQHFVVIRLKYELLTI